MLGSIQARTIGGASGTGDRERETDCRNLGGKAKRLSEVPWWVSNEEPFLLSVTKTSAMRGADLSAATSRDVRETWRHHAIPCSFSLLHQVLLEMKRNGGRGQSREGSRPHSSQYFGSTAEMGFVQDPHQISPNPQKAAFLRNTAPPSEESGLIAGFPTT